MRADEFRSELRARLELHATDVLMHIVVSGGETVSLTGGDILCKCERLAELSKAPAGGVVLLLLPHSVELFLMHIGLVLTGRVPTILAWPTSRVDPEKYQRNLLHQLGNLPADELITISGLAENLGSALSYRAVRCPMEGVSQWEESFSNKFRFPKDDISKPSFLPSSDLGEALFLQFSGGTTGSQKAVVITAPMLDRQLECLREALCFSSEDVVISWLPLYHDMGLIGCLWLPLWHAAPSVQFAASDWLLDPARVFEYLESYEGTFCWLPNFAFSYMAGQRVRMKGRYSLGHVRAYVDCSEPVRWSSLQRFAETFADWDVSLEQIQASYAMAENVFAVTQTKIGQAPKTVARKAVKKSGSGAPLAFDLIDDVYVSSGAPVGGVQIRIVDSERNVCLELEPGEIQISTESMFSGYWGSQGFTTTPFTSDGWYATGDYGFLSDGELYVIGRLKDIVIVGGQNIFPEDVENVINVICGISPGRVVAFGIENAHATESLIVVAEMKGAYDRDRAAALEKEMARQILTTIGISPGRVCALPERWIVKSTAGKISRRETRERYLRELARPMESRVAAAEAQ